MSLHAQTYHIKGVKMNTEYLKEYLIADIFNLMDTEALSVELYERLQDTSIKELNGIKGALL